ncbi:CPBP family intramembrane glutamic endopeptidase [Pinibacter aurantiacus]|uniref:CPBP family intramembrane metalloprotease n=1 Tax=Pinibacter aurantiacus TaxID=2851599 RepID=A0A9E2S7N7_9BACT|nr:CPBP family intramembrane glutamic endopeptidase [Pinibacter aurantiacus]MBV4357386.1 CPBP family intramembrane metalloprotease [Pinibacter aurantiacus]
MNTYLKYKPVWLQFIVLGALFFLTSGVLGSAAGYSIAGAYHVSVNELMNPTSPAAVTASKLNLAVSSIFVFGMSGFLFSYMSDHHPFKFLGFKQPAPQIFLSIGVIILLTSLPALSWFAIINKQVHLPSGLQETFKKFDDLNKQMMTKMLVMPSAKDLFLNIIVFGVIPAIMEEIFFRGALQRIFIRLFKSPVIGILVTAFVFSAAHMEFSGFLVRLVLGALLGALYWYSGSLWPGILMHFLNNAMQILVLYFYPQTMVEDTHFNVWLVAVSCLSIVLILIWMKRISHTHYGEVYDNDDFTIEPIDRN